MSIQHISQLGAAQAGGIGAALRARCSRAGRAVWSALEAYGNQRARRELLRLADHYRPINPELAGQMRAAWLDLARR